MSSLQDKLYKYEQAPPATVWDKVAAALDESHLSDQFPSKLYNAEVTPPENAWEKISGALGPETVPMTGKSFSFFRYAAAAVLIGLVVFCVIKLMNSGKLETDKNLAAVDSTGNNKKTSNSTNSIEAGIDKTAKNVDLEENKTTEVAEAPVKTRMVKKTRDHYSNGDNSDVVEPIYAYNEPANKLADRYIMYMTPDGGIVRMSKKWGNLICCVSGQEQDEDCKDQLKKWQEKMACAPVATSNFMDILSLVNTLNNTEL